MGESQSKHAELTGGIRCPECGVKVAIVQAIGNPQERTAFMGWTWDKVPPAPSYYANDLMVKSETPEFDKALPRERKCEWTKDGYKHLHFRVQVWGKWQDRIARWKSS